MKIFVGADHRGFQLKHQLIEYLQRAGYDVADTGDEKLDPDDDFTTFAGKAMAALFASDDPDSRVILICGSGQGMCMAANRFKGIRAALGYDRDSAKASRNDDDSNVLCLPANILEAKQADVIVETWINTPFAAAPRYVRRVRAMDTLT
jgi:ribose 5-phosphate isomerase B